MKSASLILVLAAAGIYTPVHAGKAPRSTDSLAVEAAAASSTSSPGTATGTASEVTSPRDAASGQSSGKRVATGDVDGDGMSNETAVSSPRDAASGQATGKRQHKPSIRSADAGGDAGTDEAAAAKTKPTSSSYDLKMGTK
jgi:hypothetical protein